MIVRAAICHEASHTTTSRMRTPVTTLQSLVRRFLGAVSSSAVDAVEADDAVTVLSGCWVSSDTGGSSGSGDLDLFAQGVPHALVDLDELRGEPDLLAPAWTRQVEVDVVLDGGRAGGHHDDPVGEADLLGEVVGDEHDGRP